jgi:hypothetical protein
MSSLNWFEKKIGNRDNILSHWFPVLGPFPV